LRNGTGIALSRYVSNAKIGFQLLRPMHNQHDILLAYSSPETTGGFLRGMSESEDEKIEAATSFENLACRFVLPSSTSRFLALKDVDVRRQAASLFLFR
jgi:hypothetical protein